MAEANLQVIYTPVPGEEPFVNDLEAGSLCANTADGRLWVGDDSGIPVELGGATKIKPIGSLNTSNYLDIEITSPTNLPIPTTDPLKVPVGFYKEHRILIRFTQNPIDPNFSAYFDFPINWGVDWPTQSPVDFYKAQGRKILIELSSFGPSTEWIGRVLWANTLS